jgi:hypothetical protein
LDGLTAAASAQTEQEKLKPIYAEMMRLVALGFFTVRNAAARDAWHSMCTSARRGGCSRRQSGTDVPIG